MKNKLTKILSLMISLSLIISATAFAAVPDLVIERSQDESTVKQTIKISGKAENCNGKYLTIKMFSKDKNPKDNIEDYEFFGQVTLSEDKTFVFKKEYNGNPADYKVVLTGENYNEEKEFYFPGLTITNDFLKALNDKTITAKDAVSKVETNNKDLVFDTTVYGDFSNKGKENTFLLILKSEDNIDIESLYTKFNESVILSAFNMAEGNSVVAKTINYYENILNLKNEKTYPLYEESEEKGKNDVYSFMQGKDFKNIPDINKAFNDGVILSGYKNVSSHREITKIFDEYLRDKEEVKNFNKMTSKNKDYGLRYLIAEKNKVTSYDGFLRKIAYTVSNIDEIAKKYKENNSGGGSSGGGGGGGSQIITTDPPKKDIDNNVDIKKGFNDLGSYSWAKDAIEKLYAKGIVKGKAENKFMPQDNVTRAEFIKMIVTGLNEVTNDDKIIFDDLSNHWANNFVNSAFNKGYVTGISDTLFGPDNNITRQDSAVIIYRVLNIKAKAEKVNSLKESYKDIKEASDYAERSITMLLEYNLMKGFSDNTFRPLNNLTRAEAAVLINNFFEFLNK